MIRYLLAPRPGPYWGAGKIGFFLAGSAVAVAAALPARGVATWLLAFVLYELIVSQGKYFLNDFAGRGSDRCFLRGAGNRFPRGPAGAAVGAYALIRCLGGLAGLLLLLGPAGAICGGLTLALQVGYEAIKRLRLPLCGPALMLVVSANYGVRCLAGLAAIDPSAVFSAYGALLLLWGAALGALFLSIYWQRQGAYYMQAGQPSAALLARYKPGVVWIHGLHARAASRDGITPERSVLLPLAFAVLSALAVPRTELLARLLPAALLVAFTACAYRVLTANLTAPRGPAIATTEERDAA